MLDPGAISCWPCRRGWARLLRTADDNKEPSPSAPLSGASGSKERVPSAEDVGAPGHPRAPPPRHRDCFRIFAMELLRALPLSPRVPGRLDRIPREMLLFLRVRKELDGRQGRLLRFQGLAGGRRLSAGLGFLAAAQKPLRFVDRPPARIQRLLEMGERYRIQQPVSDQRRRKMRLSERQGSQHVPVLHGEDLDLHHAVGNPGEPRTAWD
ncbi:uncharacterized protein [Apteryx mantelli]|uniref:Uncharacterized protein n=1 Tax=Apteryx mantelli TaxID=2696672 RepID=A0ABM4FYD7_9AVES